MIPLKTLRFNYPVLRVNNRDLNIAFYQEKLGMKCFYEENAIALFAGRHQNKERFVIEESPAARTRAVEGPKKLNRLYIQAAVAQEVEALLAQVDQPERVFQGAKGYAFEVVSPEGDHIILHAEDDLTSLVEIDRPDLSAPEGQVILTDFKVSAISLNVPNQTLAQDFYQTLLQRQLPLDLSFVEEEGPDLTLEPNVAWDLEILDFGVSADQDMQSLKTYFEDQGLSVYLDKKERVLVISDPSQIEIWFRK